MLRARLAGRQRRAHRGHGKPLPSAAPRSHPPAQPEEGRGRHGDPGIRASPPPPPSRLLDACLQRWGASPSHALRALPALQYLGRGRTPTACQPCVGAAKRARHRVAAASQPVRAGLGSDAGLVEAETRRRLERTGTVSGFGLGGASLRAVLAKVCSQQLGVVAFVKSS